MPPAFPDALGLVVQGDLDKVEPLSLEGDDGEQGLPCLLASHFACARGLLGLLLPYEAYTISHTHTHTPQEI